MSGPEYAAGMMTMAFLSAALEEPELDAELLEAELLEAELLDAEPLDPEGLGMFGGADVCVLVQICFRDILMQVSPRKLTMNAKKVLQNVLWIPKTNFMMPMGYIGVLYSPNTFHR
jgi:hypothetical protein